MIFAVPMCIYCTVTLQNIALQFFHLAFLFLFTSLLLTKVFYLTSPKRAHINSLFTFPITFKNGPCKPLLSLHFHSYLPMFVAYWFLLTLLLFMQPIITILSYMCTFCKFESIFVLVTKYILCNVYGFTEDYPFYSLCSKTK